MSRPRCRELWGAFQRIMDGLNRRVQIEDIQGDKKRKGRIWYNWQRAS